jgi:hypothetical protein
MFEVESESRRFLAVPPLGAIPEADGKRFDGRRRKKLIEEFEGLQNSKIPARRLLGQLSGHKATSLVK